MSTSGFLQKANREIIREISTDLLHTQYKFHKLTNQIIMPEIYQKLEEFIDVQQQMIYKNRFHYHSVKDMNKELLKHVNTFLYHLYKQYKTKYRVDLSKNGNQSLTEIYTRPQTTQDYKTDRQNELEKVMRLNQQDMDSYQKKPRQEVQFSLEEDEPIDPSEMNKLIQQRQQEYQQYEIQPPILKTKEPRQSKQQTPSQSPSPSPSHQQPSKSSKKVSFGENNEKSFDTTQPVHQPPSIDRLFSRLKPQQSQQSQPETQTRQQIIEQTTQQPHLMIQHNDKTPMLKRIALYMATTSARHHFLRIRAEHSTQSAKQHAVNIVNTLTSDLTNQLNRYQQPFEEYLLNHAQPLWEWWCFIEDIIRNDSKHEAQRWIQYIHLDTLTALDFDKYPFLRGWLDDVITLPSTKSETDSK